MSETTSDSVSRGVEERDAHGARDDSGGGGSPGSAFVIRILDIAFSSTALILLSPLLLSIMLVLRFSGEGEVFFSQPRVGRHGRLFPLLKFATMLKDSPNIGTGVLTLKGDPRILPFGHWLRKTKLNELPQLLNILRGDMSLIGPRPQAPAHFEVFPAAVKETLKAVSPGLSGIGSVVFRDEENVLARADDEARFYAEVIAPYKGAVEAWYVRRRSVMLYLTLIFLTVWVVLFPFSRLHRRIFPDMPLPPQELAHL